MSSGEDIRDAGEESVRIDSAVGPDSGVGPDADPTERSSGGLPVVMPPATDAARGRTSALAPGPRPSPDGAASPADPIAEHIAAVLAEIGEDPAREGLLKTPGRVARALRELTAGYGQDVQDILNQAFFTEHYDEMVIVKDIELHSMCEHHMLPFFGKCHVAYLPKGKIDRKSVV